MTNSVSLLFGVHAHQPVGNFPEVIDDAHERCYKPFIHTLYRFPDFRFAVHFSGWLFDYLLEKFPDDMALMKEMIARGQVELFGAGDTEPVLAVIPEQDRRGQLDRFSDKLEKEFGQRPAGAWLTERVWEATVVPSLAESGIRYVTVDDYHFLCAGKENHQLDGYYTTEEGGHTLDLFPISEGLRYRIPFAPAHEVVSYMESMAKEGQNTAAVYFDDIEKFGIWPETYDWVYGRKWLENFIQCVLDSDIINPVTYRDYHAAVSTNGIVYLPTTSYIEMNEWTLAAPAAARYAELVEREKSGGQYDEHKAYVRGGIWKNFFSRYPESNWMHKRMQSLSLRLAALPKSKQSDDLLDDLYEAQANDAYWHGMFGGLYLPHLRRAIYNAIVRLEGKLDQLSARKGKAVSDLDKDGIEELAMYNDHLQAIIKLDHLGMIHEFDDYQLHHNYGDTLRRQQEHYFKKILDHQGHDNQYEGEGIASAHDRVSFKHEISHDDLLTDDRPQGLFSESLHTGHETLTIDRYELQSSNKKQARFVAHAGPGELHKKLSLNKNVLKAVFSSHNLVDGQLSTRLVVAMPSCDGPAGRFISGQQVVGGFGELLQLNEITELTLDDAVLGGHLTISSSVAVQVDSKPYFTVSQSEAGFEKIMQGVEITLSWPVQQECVISVTSNSQTVEL